MLFRASLPNIFVFSLTVSSYTRLNSAARRRPARRARACFCFFVLVRVELACALVGLAHAGLPAASSNLYSSKVVRMD